MGFSSRGPAGSFSSKDYTSKKWFKEKYFIPSHFIVLGMRRIKPVFFDFNDCCMNSNIRRRIFWLQAKVFDLLIVMAT
jgi:hypothetical protein